MEKELSKILKIIDEEPEKFNAKIPDIEKKIFRDISILVKDLRLTPGGNVAPSIENLNTINSIKSKIGKIAVSKEYADLVKRFISNFPAISNYQTSLNTVPTGTKKLISAATKQNIDNTLESLIGSGYKQEVVSKLNSILLTSVTSGGSYADLTEQLQRQLISTEKKPGLLSKYAKTYVVDSLGQLAGQGNKMIADALNSEWFQYVGSNLTTTREFCEHLTKKRYVHKSEFKTLLEGKIDGHECKINEATGLPQGMKEGTNVDNFIENRGGWNCGHELIPVDELTVPEIIRDKLKIYIEDKNKITNNSIEEYVTKNVKDINNISNEELKNVIMDISKDNPDIFNGKLKDVVYTRKAKDGLMAIIRERNEDGTFNVDKGNILKIKDFEEIHLGYSFNPAKELKSAMQTIKEGQELTFNQEYAIESMWHEFRHAGAKGWKNSNNIDDYKIDAMETINQFCARHSYSEFIEKLGGKSIHKEEIIEKGYGYTHYIDNFRSILKKYKIDETETYIYFKDLIQNEDYENIQYKMSDFFNNNGIVNGEELTKNISRVDFYIFLK